MKKTGKQLDAEIEASLHRQDAKSVMTTNQPETNYLRNKLGAVMIGKWEKRDDDGFVVSLKTNREATELFGGTIYAESKAGNKALVRIDDVVEIKDFGGGDRHAILRVSRM